MCVCVGGGWGRFHHNPERLLGDTETSPQFFRHLQLQGGQVGGYSLAEMLVGKRGTQGSYPHIFSSDFPAEPG